MSGRSGLADFIRPQATPVPSVRPDSFPPRPAASVGPRLLGGPGGLGG